MEKGRQEIQFIIDHLSEKGVEKLLNYLRKDFAKQSESNCNKHFVSISFADKRQFIKDLAVYDKKCHQMHVDGELPRRHFISGVKYMIYRLRERLANEC